MCKQIDISKQTIQNIDVSSQRKQENTYKG